MNLQRRFTIFALVTVTVLSGVMGSFLIQQSYLQALNRINNEIRNIVTAVEVAPQDKVTTALAYGRDAQVPISIYIKDGESAPLPILERGDGLPESDLKNLASKSALGKVISAAGNSFGLVEIEGGSELLIISATGQATQERNRSLATMALLLLFIFLAMLIALRLIVSRDIARERTLIETSERLRSEAERRKLLLDFAGDASHELRTPLTVIKGYLELGKKSPEILSSSENVERLLHESVRMERTIGQLLEVFEIESVPREELRRINLSTHLQSKVDVFAETNTQRSVTHEIESDLYVLATEELLDRIFGNLLGNIYRHTPQDASVSISAHLRSGNIEIEFNDAGPGMANLDKTRLFTRYDKSRSQESGGAGLGLSIVSAAISRIGGEIEIGRSELGGVKTVLKIPSD